MTTPDPAGYTLQQAQRDIAQLRGQQARTGVSLASGFAGFRSISPAADFTSYTVTSASAITQCSKAWSIPANDAQIGTTYRLTTYLSGTQGSTAQKLAIAGLVGVQAEATLPSTFAAINASFGCVVVFMISVISATTANFYLTAAANGPNVTGAFGVGFVNAGSFTASTGYTMELGCQWGSTTGAPTITSRNSVLERLGP